MNQKICLIIFQPFLINYVDPEDMVNAGAGLTKPSPKARQRALAPSMRCLVREGVLFGSREVWPSQMTL